MGKIFEQYPEQSISASGNEEIPAAQNVFTKRELDILKKLSKQLKKFNKCQKKVEEQCIAEQEKIEQQKNTADREEKEKQEKGKTEGNGKRFLNKLGDVILKVLPSVLRTVVKFAVPAVLGYIFRQKVCTV